MTLYHPKKSLTLPIRLNDSASYGGPIVHRVLKGRFVQSDHVRVGEEYVCGLLYSDKDTNLRKSVSSLRLRIRRTGCFVGRRLPGCES